VSRPAKAKRIGTDISVGHRPNDWSVALRERERNSEVPVVHTTGECRADRERRRVETRVRRRTLGGGGCPPPL